MQDDTFGTPQTDEDNAALDAILLASFSIPDDVWPRFVERVGRDAFRVCRVDGVVRGALAALPMAQWWGGREVRMLGVAVVGVESSHRGSGVADALMRGTLREARAQGYPISALYPATQGPYRKVGYEQAGVKHTWVLDLDRIGRQDRSLPVHTLTALEPGELGPIYDRFARQHDGTLIRGPVAWSRILRPRGRPSRGVLLGDPAAPEGYLVWTQPPGPDHRYDLEVDDFVACTPRALSRAWAFLADHRSLAARAHWYGPANDPRLLPLPEQSAKVEHTMNFMVRILDVRAALEARGWLGTGAMDLVVADELFPENAGAWHLDVREGRATVTRPVAQPVHGLHISIRGLASLYAGFLSAHALMLAGLCHGEAAALVSADTLFRRGDPWMADHF